MSLLVFEGIDGSGKSTQFQLICRYLERRGTPYTRLVFPQYQEPSSALLRMYLAGEFGSDPESVNAYAASTFYAVDRYASYRKVWGDAYAAGGVVVADRYTTSNAIHQGAKLRGPERRQFFQWLEELEYTRMELPKPDIVLYMEVPLAAALSNMRAREAETDTTADIHEAKDSYLQTCLDAAEDAAAYYGWQRIRCTENGGMRSELDIHREITEFLFPKG